MFLISGHPRCGSTTLQRMMNCHQDLNCCSEPFHPRRYDGVYHADALARNSVRNALMYLSSSWHGLKHVWDPETGWPFRSRIQLNYELVAEVSVVIRVNRENLLRQYVSSFVSRHIGFWVGTKVEFLERLARSTLPVLELDDAERFILAAKRARAQQDALLQMAGKRCETLAFERVIEQFGDQRSTVGFANHLFDVVGAAHLRPERYGALMAACNPETFRWASEEVYRCIPGAEQLDADLGSAETGYLFKRE